jgi:phosphotransferase system  glucose/maltose/N-acetylglucosamine-specific IIC component
MTVNFGIGMFFYGMTCIFIGAIIVYFVINKFNKSSEQIEQEENQKYLEELRNKL